MPATKKGIMAFATMKTTKPVCAELVDVVRGAKDKRLRMKGPHRIPTKVPHITTRKSPCGEGIHKNSDAVHAVSRTFIPLLDIYIYSILCFSFGFQEPTLSEANYIHHY
ncbi:hypothetical protein Patl1_00252 [Pistacia atlantica]|uniref:Uncharacterized protein n=1 Tax=Pistacia atlantica TaxID=434234 RepID=A0ACC1C5Y7_9ROSI|nr:hypothetical protein Patl1_00252 [Pistacia atlantica]